MSCLAWGGKTVRHHGGGELCIKWDVKYLNIIGVINARHMKASSKILMMLTLPAVFRFFSQNKNKKRKSRFLLHCLCFEYIKKRKKPNDSNQFSFTSQSSLANVLHNFFLIFSIPPSTRGSFSLLSSFETQNQRLSTAEIKMDMRPAIHRTRRGASESFNRHYRSRPKWQSRHRV